MEFLLEQFLAAWNTVQAYFVFDTSLLATTDMIARITFQLMLLFASAFFSGSETALFALSRLDLEKLRRERNPHSETLHALLDHPRRLIISILCGNELVNIAAAANMTGILVTLYGVEKAGVIAALIMIPLLLLFGEVTPKTIAVSNPIRVSTRVVARPMQHWVRLIAPLRWAIRAIADRLTTTIVGEETGRENILQVDEFRTLVEEVAREGQLDATERALIYNLLEAGDTEIVEIMRPRTQIAFLDAAMSVPEMVEEFRRSRHPRVPVYRGHRDNLVGFVHAEDVLRLVLDGADLSALTPEDIMHPPVVAPPTKLVDEMFDFFQERQVRAAVVVNEFGGVDGIITMKDVLTFIFGQISGEVTGIEHYRERDENVYEVPGDMKLNDFNNLTHFGIEDPRMTTIGGVAFRHLDRLPEVGDTVSVEGIIIRVTAMVGHRIARVKVVRGGTSEDLEDAEATEAAAPPRETHRPDARAVIDDQAHAVETGDAGGEETP